MQRYEVYRYVCDICGREFSDPTECENHENQHGTQRQQGSRNLNLIKAMCGIENDEFELVKSK